MKKWINPRLPSCPRDPSKRLHPLLPTPPVSVEPPSGSDSATETASNSRYSSSDEENGDTDKPDRTENTQSVSDFSEDEIQVREQSNEENDSDSSNEEDNFLDIVSEPGSEFSFNITMARPQIKFLSPPTFKGNPEEDALDWLDRYEKIGTYNRWGGAELRANFSMYLDGAARKWYFCSTLPAGWADLPVRPDPANAGVNLPAAIGLKTQFLQEFQHENFAVFQEAKLRNRIQGIEEPTSGYYYDILDLCRVVNPAMAEAAKLEYLFRGLRPTLLEKIYPLRPQTCADFLGAVKIHAEAAMMANRRGWAESVLPVRTPEQIEAPIAFVRTESRTPVAGPEQDLWKVIRELQASVEKLKIKPTTEEKRVSWTPETINRSNRGTLKCNFCQKIGHMARNCYSNPRSIRYREQSPIQTERSRENQNSPDYPVTMVTLESKPFCSTVDNTKLEQPILLLDFSNLITERVMCGKEEVLAVVDTGAAVTVISPELLERTEFPLRPWKGPRICMANGTAAQPIGSAAISVKVKNGLTNIVAVVLKMKGIELLLGNDFLKQFGRLQIEYLDSTAQATLGDLPLAAITSEALIVPQAVGTKLITAKATEIPAFSVVTVATQSHTITSNHLILEPSKNLLKTKAVSTGHALIKADVTTIPVANLSSTPVWLIEGATLGTVEAYEGEIVDCDLKLSTQEKQKNLVSDKATTRNKELLAKLKSQVNGDIPEDQRRQVTQILLEHLECFAVDEMDQGKCNVSTHDINTGSASAVHQTPYSSAWKAREIIQTQVDTMLSSGIIESSDSPWSSPVVLVKKKDGTWRFCVDYRKLNAVTVRDVYPLPKIADALSRLEGSNFFSIMDLQAGYHQVPLKEEDRPKTAFVTADGLYQFRVLPFGLTNAPGTFQRTMDIILGGLRWTTCLVYLDDVIVYSPTFEGHLERLRLILTCLAKAGLKLKWSKCRFAETSLKVLGHIVSKDGIAPDPEKLAAIRDFTPCNEGKTAASKVKKVQSFLGLCSYYRRHIRDFAKLARPLTLLIKKDTTFVWGEDQVNSFSSLKNALISAPVLAHPNYKLPMTIIPDACGYGIGAVLAQYIEGNEHPLAYASRLLCKSEVNYSITEKECLALVWSITKFRSFVWGCKITIVTDHQALCWLMSKQDLAGRLARWSLSLQEYDLKIVYRSGKLHDNADCLSRYPLESREEEEDDRCITIATLTTPIPQEIGDDLNLVEEQRRVVRWRRLMDQLEAGRATKNNFCLRNTQLYLQTIKDGKSYTRLCVPRSFRDRILKAFHDDLISGHMGIKRTLTKISNRFFWPRLAEDVTNYVQACPSCQGRKGVQDKPNGLLQCIQVERPFQKVGIDLLGPFPLSNQGNRNIIVAVDYLTKWVELRAMPTGKAEEVADFFIQQIVLRHGAPEQIITDRGKCFVAELTKSVVNKLQSNHKTTSSYHPQANGQVERMNHTLAAMLSMYVSSDHKDWDETLQYVGFAYNSARQESTGFSPFFLLYGREPRLPIDLELRTDPNPLTRIEDTNTDYASRMLAEMKKARALIQTRLGVAQDKQRRTYDSRHKDLQFKPGDLVLIYKPFRKVGRAEKLLHRWLGPFRVIRQTTPVNYEVQLRSGRGKSDIVHVVKMKKYRELARTDDQPEEIAGNQTLTDEVTVKESRPEVEIQQKESQPEVEIQRKDMDQSKTVVPQGKPGKNAAEKPRSDQKTPTRIQPLRARRRPNRLVAFLLPYTLCMLALIYPHSTNSVLVRETALFNERPGVAFSESFWTIVTDLDLRPVNTAIQFVEERIKEQMTMAAKHRFEHKFRPNLMAAKKIEEKMHLFQRELSHSKKRLDIFSKAIGSGSRDRRAAIDAGGLALKWLFGVATQTDLENTNKRINALSRNDQEIVHLLDRQATVVNESLWEIKTATEMIRDLQGQTQSLKTITTRLLARIEKEQETFADTMEYFTYLETTFDSIAAILLWVHQLADAFDVGLDLLANGRLAPQIFPPAQMATVLRDVNNHLPLGWAVSSDELWVTYREATVSVAAVNGRFRLFIQIPIYDHAQQYTLFEIFSLPQATDNGTHGVVFSNLPNFLAVSTDLETFIELTTDEVRGCKKLERQLCNFHTGLSKRSARKSCAVSLFLNDPTRKMAQCKKKFIEWKGPEVAYLGQNRWAFSAVGPHDVVFSCPTGSSHLPPQTLRLPAVGIFEVPPGCTARTEDWVFPASLEGQLEITLTPSPIPNLTGPERNKTIASPIAIMPFIQENATAVNYISSLLSRNEQARLSSEMTGLQIQRLMGEAAADQKMLETRYPFELLFFLAVLSIAIAYLGYKSLLLSWRMTAHEKVDLLLPLAQRESEEIQM